MTKYTLQDRLILFVAISLMYAYCYQIYHNNQQDKYIDEALETHNKTYQRAVEINNELRAENKALNHILIHEQAMYEASKGHVEMLEEQINVVGDYYLKEITKVNDELFDLKNTHSGKNKPEIVILEEKKGIFPEKKE